MSGSRPGSRSERERLEALLRSARRPVLVVGLGNDALGDDGVGCRVARDLECLDRPGLLALDAGIAIENAGPSVRRAAPGLVLLVDAATLPGRAPWRLLPTSGLDTFCHSTHSVPLPLLVAAWRQEVPHLAARFVGIRPHDSGLGAPLTPEVEAARAEVVAAIRAGF